jgi:hypothetical protein
VRTSRRDLAIGASLFIFVLLADFGYGITTSFDSRYTIHVAMSIVRRHTTTLDAYPDLPDDQPIRTRDGHRYSFFPIGTPLLAVPFVAAIDAGSRSLLAFESSGFTAPFDLDALLRRAVPIGIERFIAATFVATTSLLIYALARLSIRSKARALLVALVFAFATSAWSTASRGLWQHGPSMMCLAATLLLLACARERPRLAAFAALPLAYSYVVRPTNSVSIVVFTLFVLIEHRRQLALFLGLAAAVAIPFVAYNLSVDHTALPPYYGSGNLVLGTSLLEALPGNWISPSRGILVFSPVLVFALWGARERLRSGARLDRFVAAAIVLHWLVISAGKTWTGDNCFGNRYFSDVLPYFMWFLIPAVARVARSRALIAIFAVATAVSFAIHRRGVTSWDVYNWNLGPPYIEKDRSRVWSVRDIQFLRGLL